MKTSTSQSGFTLIELLISLSIVGILTAVAIPVYKNYAFEVTRSEALVIGQDFAQKQENHFNMYGRYGTVANLEAVGLALDFSEGGNVLDNKYKVDTTSSTNAFSITLTAQNGQEQDTDCLTIQFTETSLTTNSNASTAQFCSSTAP